eukprot:TRINITY_DN595_c0_g2_i1.p1 TRINITY_DN595_c0_g2~~TRINITY_DN595_c0_g2_i1.p1  ORF type:complete len:351 (+),score=101.55 TRINITY_DN595_c0_g2_i1:79-1131(+)
MTEVCAAHGKARTVANLMFESGEWMCKPGSECRDSGFAAEPAAPSSSSARIEHVTVGAGLGSRIPTSTLPTCTTALAVRGGHVIRHPKQAEVCHAHGVRRKADRLYQVMTDIGPQWECILEDRCKSAQGGGGPMAAASLPSSRFSPYGSGAGAGAGLGLAGRGKKGEATGRGGKGTRGRAAGGRGGGKAAADPTYCSAHSKTRSAECLELQRNGLYACKAAQQCKVRGDPEYCSVHDKRRSAACLTQQHDGTYACAADHRCKVASGDVVRDPEWCSVHNKRRGAAYLEAEADGSYTCTADHRCRNGWNDAAVPGNCATGECVVHNKMRKAEYLEEGEFGLQCIDSRPCRA